MRLSKRAKRRLVVVAVICGLAVCGVSGWRIVRIHRRETHFVIGHWHALSPVYLDLLCAVACDSRRFPASGGIL